MRFIVTLFLVSFFLTLSSDLWAVRHDPALAGQKRRAEAPAAGLAEEGDDLDESEDSEARAPETGVSLSETRARLTSAGNLLKAKDTAQEARREATLYLIDTALSRNQSSSFHQSLALNYLLNYEGATSEELDHLLTQLYPSLDIQFTTLDHRHQAGVSTAILRKIVGAKQLTPLQKNKSATLLLGWITSQNPNIYDGWRIASLNALVTHKNKLTDTLREQILNLVKTLSATIPAKNPWRFLLDIRKFSNKLNFTATPAIIQRLIQLEVKAAPAYQYPSNWDQTENAVYHDLIKNLDSMIDLQTFFSFEAYDRDSGLNSSPGTATHLLEELYQNIDRVTAEPHGFKKLPDAADLRNRIQAGWHQILMDPGFKTPFWVRAHAGHFLLKHPETPLDLKRQAAQFLLSFTEKGPEHPSFSSAGPDFDRLIAALTIYLTPFEDLDFKQKAESLLMNILNLPMGSTLAQPQQFQPSIRVKTGILLLSLKQGAHYLIEDTRPIRTQILHELARLASGEDPSISVQGQFNLAHALLFGPSHHPHQIRIAAHLMSCIAIQSHDRTFPPFVRLNAALFAFRTENASPETHARAKDFLINVAHAHYPSLTDIQLRKAAAQDLIHQGIQLPGPLLLELGFPPPPPPAVGINVHNAKMTEGVLKQLRILKGDLFPAGMSTTLYIETINEVYSQIFSLPTREETGDLSHRTKKSQKDALATFKYLVNQSLGRDQFATTEDVQFGYAEDQMHLSHIIFKVCRRIQTLPADQIPLAIKNFAESLSEIGFIADDGKFNIFCPTGRITRILQSLHPYYPELANASTMEPKDLIEEVWDREFKTIESIYSKETHTPEDIEALRQFSKNFSNKVTQRYQTDPDWLKIKSLLEKRVHDFEELVIPPTNKP